MLVALTTGGDMIRGGVKAFLLAAGIALFVFFRESSSPETRRRRVRLLTWGAVACVGAAGVAAMLLGGIMLAAGVTYN